MDYRKGSMGAAEKKSNKLFIVIAGVVYAAILLCLFVLNTDLRAFANRASTFSNILGFLMIVASYGVLLYAAKNDTGKAIYIAAIALLLVFGICTACGFNFDYYEIEETFPN